MTNLAGVRTCDATILLELQAAGIDAYRIPFLEPGEVPTQIVGFLAGWKLTRAWRYWVASGPGIPPRIAQLLHEQHGSAVRVEGHCGCPSPLEWAGGFAVGEYHIDTQDGLTAFAAVLRAIVDENLRELGAASRWARPQATTWLIAKHARQVDA